MKKYNLNIKITEGDSELQKNLILNAENSNELSQKLNALKVLNESIKHEDLMATVEMIHEKPEIIPIVKDMLDDGDKYTEAQMMVRLPGYVKKVLRVLKS
jgi:alkyl hydroperoxide reductase subunit AhpF